MKILVFSDSHGRMAHMLAAVRAKGPDLVLHLGDLMEDALALQAACPGLRVEYVPGNCDGLTWLPPTRLLEVEGRRLLLGHGHTWQVKRTEALALAAARVENAGLLLFGHTHRAVCRREGALWVMNPGAAKDGSFGELVLEKQEMICYTSAD